jgi:ParB-like chromosome segregation protein Spo0J
MSKFTKHYKTDPELKAELDKYLPPMSEEAYQKLKANITPEYDDAKPIVLWKERPDTIVDGHHRYRACCELGIEVPVVVISFKSVNAAVLYALKGFLTGRELTVGQRVIAVLQMLTLEGREVMDQEAKENQTFVSSTFFYRPCAARRNGTNQRGS